MNDTITILLNCFTYALMASGLVYSMHAREEILGFIPALVEKYIGINNPLYKILTCKMCMAGQIALFTQVVTSLYTHPIGGGVAINLLVATPSLIAHILCSIAWALIISKISE